LQHPLNKGIRYIHSEKGKGIAGSVIFHLVLLLLAIFLAFTLPDPPETEEGILVNFGTDLTGMGMIEPSAPAVQTEAAPPPPAQQPAVQQTNDVPMLTQNTEEAPEVKKVDPEAEKRKLEKIEADRKIREQLEAERKIREQEEAERKRIEAERQRAEDIANKTKNALANSKNAGTASTSEGVAGGSGNQGVPTGSVNATNRGEGGGLGDGKVSYDLGGRGATSLPTPSYNLQEEGKVVVEVSVDKLGNVTQANPGVKGSTTLNEVLLRLARDAAMKAKFEPSPNAPLTQKGTITYNFLLK
jgi:colicin import membrane protein